MSQTYQGPNYRRLYEQMVLIRVLEEQLFELCKQGKAGDLHFNRGQEAIAVGVIAALKRTDYIVTHHRTIAHAVAKGSGLHPLVAEILGKKTGWNGGRAGEMHLSIPAIRHAFSFQLVGTCVPVAAGLAWALKYHQKTDDIVACFFGDAASSNGAVHEALTIAAIKRVPLLLICENNGRAGNVTADKYLPTQNVSERMAAYGIRTYEVNGNRLDQVLDQAEHAAWAVRNECRPVLLECKTERLGPHKIGQGDMRSREEIVRLEENEPIRYCEQYVLDDGVNLAGIRARLLAEVQAAIAQADADEVAEF